MGTDLLFAIRSSCLDFLVCPSGSGSGLVSLLGALGLRSISTSAIGGGVGLPVDTLRGLADIGTPTLVAMLAK